MFSVNIPGIAACLVEAAAAAAAAEFGEVAAALFMSGSFRRTGLWLAS